MRRLARVLRHRLGGRRRTAYDQAKASAKSTYEADRKACDAQAGNPKDVCIAEAKAKRTRTEVEAEANWKGTAKAREHAAHETAEADYKVAKERCGARAATTRTSASRKPRRR